MLSGGRGASMGGPLSISFQEILAYSKIYGIEDGEELEDFTQTIRILDAEWLLDFYRRQDSKTKGKK